MVVFCLHRFVWDGKLRTLDWCLNNEHWVIKHVGVASFLHQLLHQSVCISAYHRIFSILHVYNGVSFVTKLFTVRAHWPRAGSIITPRPPTSLMRCSTQIKHEFQIFSQLNNVSKGISRFRPYVANSLLAFNVKSDSLRFSLLLAGIFLGDN